MNDLSPIDQEEAVTHEGVIPKDHKNNLMAALHSISKIDLTELKGLRSPPPEVVKVAELFLLILGEQDPGWKLLSKHIGKFSKELN